MSDDPRRLILLRHAKAEAPAGIRDHERALTDVGRADARAMGVWLKEHRVLPDLVICSTALRTRETWEQVADAGAIGALIEHEGTAYNASVPALWQLVQEAEPDARVLVVVGHSPGIPGLAALLGEGQHGVDQLSGGFPTCTAALLSIEGAWADLSAGAAVVERVHTARATEN